MVLNLTEDKTRPPVAVPELIAVPAPRLVLALAASAGDDATKETKNKVRAKIMARRFINSVYRLDKSMSTKYCKDNEERANGWRRYFSFSGNCGGIGGRKF